MALGYRQRRLYVDAVTIWRETVTYDAAGKLSARTWAVIATAVPCLFRTGLSVKGPNGEIILDESDNLFTYDEVHFEDGTDLRTGDVLKKTGGTYDVGAFWGVRGDETVRNILANKLTVRARRLPVPPAGVS